MQLSPSETSVIIGMYRQGNTLETIYYEMGLDEKQVSVIEVQKVLEHFIPQETYNYVENERYNILKNFADNNALQNA